MSVFFVLFKSKEQRAQEVKYALRTAKMNFSRWDSTLEKRKENFYKLAKQARATGSEANYSMSLKGIHLANLAQTRARNIVIQIELYSTMCEIGHMSTGFVSLLGKAGKNIQKAIANQDYMGSHQSFESSIRSLSKSFDSLELFLNNAMDSMNTGVDEIDSVTDEEITRMIDAEISGKLSEGQKDDMEFIKKLAGEWSEKSGGDRV